MGRWDMYGKQQCAAQRASGGATREKRHQWGWLVGWSAFSIVQLVLSLSFSRLVVRVGIAICPTCPMSSTTRAIRVEMGK